ncbi:hypothetical protein SORBI_3010G092350 [Sorghum bicolor]|uniref:Uncharacterized protein n=1 Tax=Sorghum bicolor TaxID=4558 RepID=A0A1W0VS48_SORBI|nr:hypothetical protein SORBI_3010G092350 [Sorghum bicolor]
MSKSFIALLFPTDEFLYLLCLAFVHWIRMLLVSRDRDILGYSFSSLDEGCGTFSLAFFSHFVVIVPKIEGYHTLCILLSFFWIIEPPR